MEIFDMAGVAGPFLQRANRVTTVAIVPQRRTLARMPFKPADTPYRFVAMVPQDVTKSLLVEELHRQGGAVEYNTACLSVEERRDSRVGVMLEQNGTTSNATAAFVVGCDGAHSKIRHLLNLPFEGAPYDASFMLADVMTNDRSPDELQLCPHASGALAIFPMSAARSRVVATIDGVDGDAPSLDMVRRLLDERAPASKRVLSYGAATSAFIIAMPESFAPAASSSPAMQRTSTVRSAAGNEHRASRRVEPGVETRSCRPWICERGSAGELRCRTPSRHQTRDWF
jgi:2-polyprenyl-6-methoxyphenol hydroxylase-like FAD-dependent oxidoreductase